jgi:hypothetical protein
VRGDGALDWSPAVEDEDGASPSPFFVSAMTNSAGDGRVNRKTEPKDGEEPFQGRRGLSPGLSLRRSPSSADINAA